MKKPILTIMIGLPRSGKSTWIKKNKKDAVVVSPDEIRAKIFGHQFHSNAEDFIWAFAKAMCRLLLEQGKDVIIDATNINSYSRNVWINIGKQYKAKVRMIWTKTSVQKCLQRNKGEKSVPKDVILKMAHVFETPSLEYLDKDIELIEIPKYKTKKYLYNYYESQLSLLNKEN